MLRRLPRWRARQCGARLHFCAVSGGGASAPRPARSSRAALAPTLVRTTVWCEAAPLYGLRRRCFCPSPCSLVAGGAGSYAGAHHGVVRGCTSVQAQAAVLLPLALLARRGLRWLLRWRAPRCGARLHLCAVSGGGALAHRPARSSRAARAPTLACTTVWCEAAPLCSLRRRCSCPSPCSLVAGCAS